MDEECKGTGSYICSFLEKTAYQLGLRHLISAALGWLARLDYGYRVQQE